MNTIYAETDPADVKSRVESDKKMFGGLEVAGKTLGVVRNQKRNRFFCST